MVLGIWKLYWHSYYGWRGEFDERYDGNPLVNAMCVGIIDHDMVQKEQLRVLVIPLYM